MTRRGAAIRPQRARAGLRLLGALVAVCGLFGASALLAPPRPMRSGSSGMAFAQIQTVPLPTYTPADRTPRETVPRDPRRVIERDQSQAAPTPSPAPTP